MQNIRQVVSLLACLLMWNMSPGQLVSAVFDGALNNDSNIYSGNCFDVEHIDERCMQGTLNHVDRYQGSLSLTSFNFHPTMDEQFHPL